MSDVPSDEDLRKSFSGPAVLANRMFCTLIGSGVRLAFMEQLGKKVPPVFRAAVVLSLQDGVALRDLLSRQLKDFEDV